MGNDESRPIDPSAPPATLKARSIEGVAEYITRGRPKRIVVMTGAGISTSAGIPDFRSPDTGLYANLARLKLPYAEAVFDINFFREQPEPFYTLAHELYPGRYRPTVTHSFCRLLHDKGMLLKLFTQNIDCLERAAGVPAERIVEAHGSFARQSCIDCHAAYPDADMRRHIAAMSIPRCPSCHGLVKPEIVFFGEALPPAFFEARALPAAADLVIVMGTSLTVQPFASLPRMVREHTPRVLINMEPVGDLGSSADDVLLLGDCDAGVRQLAEACGWLDELETLWAATAPADGLGGEEAAGTGERDAPAKSQDDVLADEVAKLTREVGEVLHLSKWHEEKVHSERGTPATSEADAKMGLTTKVTDASVSNLDHVFVGGASRENNGSAAPSAGADEAVKADGNSQPRADPGRESEKAEQADGSKL